jgi:hypothetical protein
MEISLLGLKLNIEIIILIGIIYLIMVSHTVCGCCNFPGMIESFNNMVKKNKEGFSGANTNYGQSAPYTLGQNTPIDPSLWGQQNLVVKPGQPIPPAVQTILDREPQPVPLPEGQLLMFANTPFKPECCPNTYSTGNGCACMTTEQYNFLILRGKNNVPYSEY